ncbi:MAG: helix-turn-helix domain-containing protein [Burkholderiales bacterium]|nr:helix-turn-helix domain-containing protein [Burkholderiales bacterium]
MQTTAGRLGGASRDLHIDGIQILHETFDNVSTHQFGHAPRHAYIFGVPWRMPQPGRVNGREWHGLAAWDGRREFDSIVPPMDLFSVCVDRALLADYLRVTEHVDLEHWLSRGCAVHNDAALTEQVSGRIASLFDPYFTADAGAAKSPGQQQLWTDALLEVLGPVVADHLGARRHPVYDPPQLHLVRRAREFVSARAGEPLQIHDLCEATGACRRSLQNSFKAVLGTTPLHYLRSMRLAGVRRQLLDGRSNRTVTEVAEDWGFWHLGRFGQDYRRAFGERPSETLRRSGA